MEKRKIFYGWWIVLGSVLVTATMVPLVISLSSKYLVQITGEMHLTRAQFTLTNTITQGIGIFLSPFVAKKLSSKNMKKWQSVSIFLFALAYASFSFARNVIHLYISALFVGIFFLFSALIPVSMLITNWFVAKRGVAMSIAMAGIGVGGFLFSPIVTALLERFGWRATYRIMSLVVLCVALPVSVFVFKRKPEDMGLTPYGAGATASGKHAVPGGRAVTLSVAESRSKSFFWILIVGMFLNGLINSGALGQFPPALEDLHGPGVQAVIISLYSIIGIFSKLLLGWINDRWGVRASSIFGCVTFGLAFVFMLFGSNLVMVYVMGISFGLGIGIGSVSPPLITSSVFGTEKYGEAYGFMNSAAQVGLSVGSLLTAQIYDSTGSYHAAWILLGVLTVATLLAWLGGNKQAQKYCGQPV